MSVILLAGGTGLIGSRLTEILRAQGHTVRILSRRPAGENQYAWNPEAGTIDDQALHSVDCVINLAGAGIADKRWTAARKRLLVESRVQSARALRDAFIRLGARPRVYLSASAIGFYGNSGERMMAETDAPVDNSFMADCCRQWEAAADEVAALGIRTVKFRIGIVLARQGGALAEFVKPLRFGLGAYFANGKAWYSWIHRDDICRLFMWAMDNADANGVFNAAAPGPVRNKQLVQSTARALGKSAIMVQAPALAIRIVLGEMSAVVLNSNRVSAQKVLQAGFRFEHPELDEALADVLK